MSDFHVFGNATVKSTADQDDQISGGSSPSSKILRYHPFQTPRLVSWVTLG